MMKTWQLQEAKARLSDVVRQAQRDGPQTVSVHGKPAVVVLSIDEFDRLKTKKPSFLELMRASPLVGVDLKLTRNKKPARPIDL